MEFYIFAYMFSSFWSCSYCMTTCMYSGDLLGMSCWLRSVQHAGNMSVLFCVPSVEETEAFRYHGENTMSPPPGQQRAKRSLAHVLPRL